MENSNKPKSLFLKFLPKAASAVSFQNPHFSPGRYHHHYNNHHHSSKLKGHAHKGFSGPINYSVLPDEAREKPKKDGTFEAHEPTSPKVSCMGQIKYKHKKKKLRKIASKNNNSLFLDADHLKKQNTKSAISKFFNRSMKKSKGYPSEEHGKDGRRATLDNYNNNSTKKKKNVPSLGMMNKFASGRETLASFDWTAQIAPLDHDRDYYSDDDQERRRDDHDSDEEREVIIPYSAPMLIGGRSRDDYDDDDGVMGGRLGLEPRKEVNLWKRRTMAPPPPLALNSKVRS